MMLRQTLKFASSAANKVAMATFSSPRCRRNLMRCVAAASAIPLAMIAVSAHEAQGPVPVHDLSVASSVVTAPPAPLPSIQQQPFPLAFVERLITLLGMRVDLTEDERLRHGKDNSYHEPVSHGAIAFVKTMEEVVEIVKLCSEFKVPIVGYGSGTSLEGHISGSLSPYLPSLCVDFSGMDKIISINKEDMTAIVQPGIRYEDLNTALAAYGVFFSADPGPGASIGGMVATSCGGPSAVSYGTMKDNVLSLQVVMPNGDVVRTRRRSKKSSAGYDLTHLIIGSEGTLGLVTEVTLKLRHIPAEKAVVVIDFDSVEAAAKTVTAAIAEGIQVGKAELLDDFMMKAINLESGGSANYPEKPTLFFEFSGTHSQVAEQQAAIQRIATKFHSGTFRSATNQKERESLWRARKNALWSSTALQPGSEIWITDVCVPISQFPECVRQTREDISHFRLQAPMVAHAGDGNFHLFVLISNPEELKRAVQLNEKLIARAIAMDGTCTGEHGVGIGKKKYLEAELGKEAVDLMRTIKKAVDPLGIMNPGKIFNLQLSVDVQASNASTSTSCGCH